MSKTSNSKKIISVMFTFMILFMGLSYADELISISGSIYATIMIPNTVSYGDLLIGEESAKMTLFEIETEATGSKFSLTLLNGTENAIFNVIAPPPYDTVTRLDPEVVTEFDGYQGNYTLEVISKKVGAMSYVVKIGFNESQFNFTRY